MSASKCWKCNKRWCWHRKQLRDDLFPLIVGNLIMTTMMAVTLSKPQHLTYEAVALTVVYQTLGLLMQATAYMVSRIRNDREWMRRYTQED